MIVTGIPTFCGIAVPIRMVFLPVPSSCMVSFFLAVVAFTLYNAVISKVITFTPCFSVTPFTSTDIYGSTTSLTFFSVVTIPSFLSFSFASAPEIV